MRLGLPPRSCLVPAVEPQGETFLPWPWPFSPSLRPLLHTSHTKPAQEASWLRPQSIFRVLPWPSHHQALDPPALTVAMAPDQPSPSPWVYSPHNIQDLLVKTRLSDFHSLLKTLHSCDKGLSQPHPRAPTLTSLNPTFPTLTALCSHPAVKPVSSSLFILGKLYFLQPPPWKLPHLLPLWCPAWTTDPAKITCCIRQSEVYSKGLALTDAEKRQDLRSAGWTPRTAGAVVSVAWKLENRRSPFQARSEGWSISSSSRARREGHVCPQSSQLVPSSAFCSVQTPLMVTPARIREGVCIPRPLWCIPRSPWVTC